MYVLLGSNGNIASKAATLLRASGHMVRVIGRNAASLLPLRYAGVDIAEGQIADVPFLTRAFAGASAVYSMLPFDATSSDAASAQDELGIAIAQAIAASGVKRVVNLSSIGAHLSAGTGPIAGLHSQEQRLNALTSVDVLHVRPGYFFENHLHAMDAIRATGAYMDMTAADSPLPMVATADIAHVVARELREPSTKGQAVLHVRAHKLYTMRESVAALGAVVGRDDLHYVQVEADQYRAILEQQGFSASAAYMLEEMSVAFSTGRLTRENPDGATEIAPITLEHFASTVFGPAFEYSVRSHVQLASSNR